MFTSRVRVRPRLPLRGVLPIAGLTGLLAGSLTSLPASDVLLARQSDAMFLVMIGACALPLLGFWLWAVLVLRVGWTAVLAVAVLGAAWHWSTLATLALVEQDYFGPGVRTLAVTALVSSGSVVVWLMAAFVSRCVCYRKIEQDGSLCWRCAYPLGRSSSTTCPECGRRTDAPRRVGAITRLVSLSGRHWRVSTVLVLAVVAVLTAFTLRQQIPLHRFVRVFDAAGHPAAFDLNNDGQADAAVFIPPMDAYHGARTIVLLFERPTLLSAPRIGAYRGYLVVSPRSGWLAMPTTKPGPIRVFDAGETQMLLRDGPSSPLIDELPPPAHQGPILYFGPKPSQGADD